jgi:hypothetical protein
MFLLWIQVGPKVAMKVYRNPTHAHRCLHLNPSHPYRLKRGVFRNLIRRAKVICQDQKDLNNEINNMRHELVLNSYPQEFVDSIMKPSRSNHPSSETIYQGTVVIPCVQSVSEKFRHIGNCFHLRTIFKTKHKLCGTLTITGPVRDAQKKKKQCMWAWQMLHRRKSRLLEVRTKEHKYNRTQGLLKNQK